MSDRLTLGGLTCYDPRRAAEAAARLGTPVDFLGKASAFTLPLGRDPGRGAVLMVRSDLDSLDQDTFQQLVWTSDFDTLTIQSLIITRAIILNKALTSDPNALFMVELADKRHVFPFSSIDSQYNVRMPAPSALSGPNLYYPESLNSGALWTWDTMVGDIWGELPDDAGAAPSLPYTPDGNPDDFRFLGVSAWLALHEVLDKLQVAVSYDPIEDTFSFVRLGTTQAGLSGSLDSLTSAGRLLYNFDPTESDLARMPETIRAFFHRQEAFNDSEAFAHGTENDTSRSGNWESSPLISKDVATEVSGVAAGSVLPVWDDLPALVDDEGTNTNSEALEFRASELAGNIRDRITTSDASQRKHFSGITTAILPGSEVDSVAWQDFGGDRDSAGLVTIVTQRQTATGLPDASGPLRPTWPRLSQVVQVFHSSESAGDFVEANEDGLHDARVVRFADDDAEALDDCWILFIDDFDNADGNLAERDGEYFLGRLSGIKTFEDVTKPLYAVRRGAGALIRFELTEDLAHLIATADAERLVWNGSAYVKDGIAITVINGFGGVWSGDSGNQGWAVKMADRDAVSSVDAYEIVYLQSKARFIDFTLTADMSQVDDVSSATATVVDWWGNAPNGVDPDSPVEVFDRQVGDTGKTFFAFALSGAKGMAVWNERSGEYVVVRCETKARRIRFSLNQDMATTNAIRTADVEDFWHGQDPDPGTSGIDVLNLDASNDWAFTGVIGDVGLACFNDNVGEYEIVTMEDPVNGDNVWISYLKAGNKVVHLRPSTVTGAADASIHKLQTTCGIGLDDAGHVIGAWNDFATWISPWGLGEPAGGPP